MKILYIHQYFTTPEKGGGTRSYEFAKYFIEQGHQVVMIASTNEPGFYIEDIKGIKVYWIPNYYDNSLGTLRRGISFFNFVIKSTVVSLKIRNVDICYATSTPLTIGITALVLKWFKKTPYIFEVRDLWPDFPVQMGVLKNRFFKWLGYYLEKYIYRHSESVIACSPGMRKGIMRYNLKQPVVMIPNSSDLEIFYPHKKNPCIQKKYNLENKFFVIHFGAMGLANGLEYILATAKVCQEKGEDGIAFVFAGTGKEEERMKSLVKSYRLHNVLFLGFLPKGEVAEVVNCCDMSLITFLDLPVLCTNSPNKLFDSLAAGKVCLVNSRGWTRQFLEENECGFYASPDRPDEAFQKIVCVYRNPALRKKMESNARRLAEKEFDRKKLAAKLLRHIESTRHATAI